MWFALLAEPEKLLRDNDGPLRCKSIKRNSCFDVSNIGNCFSYVFSSSCFDHTATVEAGQKLVNKCRDFAEEVPSSVIQVKPGTMWSSVDSIEKSVIFLRSLETSQIIELAQQLTGNRINFYFSSPNILVLDLVGVSTAALVRLLLGRTCLWRTVSDSISGAENCTVTRRSSAHWPVMSEGSKHVCSINSCIRSWLEIFPPV